MLLKLTMVNASVSFNKEKNELPEDSREIYLDLMKRCLTNSIYESPHYDHSCKIQYPYDDNLTRTGRCWPVDAHTMIGFKRLDNIWYCLETILKEGIPGDCIETGVWRGGATIFMRAILKVFNDLERKVWVCDSFEGLPLVNVEKYPQDRDVGCLHYINYLSVPLETVQKNFQKYGLLDNQVVFVKGYFSETLPTIPIDCIALLRLDGDYYESTMDALVNLYPKVSIGGFIIIDDWFMSSCETAILDYRKKHNITDPIIPIDGVGAYFRKTH